MRTMSPIRRRLPGLIAAAVLGTGLSGCATRPPASDPQALADYEAANDPLEPTNRFFYGVSLTVDRYTFKPVAQAYVYVLPRPVRASIHNMLVNIGQPVTFFNAVLEGKPTHAGTSLVRFAVNSTAGVGGLFDVAKSLGYKQVDADGGLTLGTWGIPTGPYLFLPVLGPSSPRGLTGFALDIGLSPYTYVPRGYGLLTFNWAVYGLGAIDARAAVLHSLDELQATALDPYATIRSAYQQQVRSRVRAIEADHSATTPDWYTR